MDLTTHFTYTCFNQKNGVFWDVPPCGSCKNRRFGGTQRLLRSVRRLLVTASVVPSSPILVTQMKEALSSSETSVLTRATRRNKPEDTILHCHRRENLKSSHVSISLVWVLYDNSLLTGPQAILKFMNIRRTVSLYSHFLTRFWLYIGLTLRERYWIAPDSNDIPQQLLQSALSHYCKLV
jgi:hypothetical protein